MKEPRQQNSLLLKTIDVLFGSKENVPKAAQTLRSWKHYWTHGANQSHESKD